MRKQSRTKRKGLGIAVAVLVVGGGFLVYMYFKPQPNAADETAQTDQAATLTETYETSSEGSTITVPKSVPPDSIKNYSLLVENEQFKIRQDPDNKAYVITLYAIINRPDQYDQYQEQLREYKNAALAYLKEQGVETNKVQIVYEPQEAAQL